MTSAGAAGAALCPITDAMDLSSSIIYIRTQVGVNIVTVSFINLH